MAGDLIIKGYVQKDRFATDEFAQVYSPEVRYEPRTKVATRPGSMRGTESVVNLDGADDDVLEIETADGLVRFVTVEQARRQTRATRSRIDELDLVRRGGSPMVSVTRSSFEIMDPAVRSALGVLTEALEKRSSESLARFLLDRPTALAAQTVARWLDRPAPDGAQAKVRRRRPKQPGLYRVRPALELEPGDRIDEKAAARLLGGKAPVLCLLHGTFSHTEAAFGALHGTPQWDQLLEEFSGRVVTLEHPTLSSSPLDNALALAKALPAGARVNLLSHSRGGLIGDALTLALGDWGNVPLPKELSGSSSAVDIALREQIVQLHKVARGKQLQVERFVRVACPARGTILASRRLDRYATYLFNALRLVPGLEGTGVLEAIKLVALTFLDKRAEPGILPGLEAQMPESPFIATINTWPVKASQELANITGDIEGSGVVDRLKVLAADMFFREDHDMVVNTGAMESGLPRVGEVRAARFKGAKYAHTHYFADHEVREALAGWLTATDISLVKGFERGNGSAVGRAQARGVDGLSGLPLTAVIVPDRLGSMLAWGGSGSGTGPQPDGTRLVWPEPSELAARLSSFLHGKACRPTGLTPSYQALHDRLAEQPGWQVESFAYDGRKSIDELAEDLAKELSRLMARAASGAAGGPADGVGVATSPGSAAAPLRIRVVAHGHGARVVLRAIARLAGRPDASDLLEGVPASAVRAALDRAVLLGPAMDTTGIDAARAEGRDMLSASLALLSRLPAAEVGGLLGRCLGPGAPGPLTTREKVALKACHVVRGSAATTWAIDEDGDLYLSDGGDGYSVGLPGEPQHGKLYQNIPFDRLITDEAVLDDVLALVDSSDKPSDAESRASNGKRSKAPRRVAVMFPTPDDLVWAGMGAPVAPRRPQRTLTVRICHGSVTAATELIIIGTQYGTPMAGAEKALDERLAGALSRHRLLGQYPGPVGTCQLFGRAEWAGPSAAVIGLGDPGDLSPGGLTAGVAQAVLRLVAAQAPSGPAKELAIGAVLIGTVGNGSIAIASSVNACITGVRRANRRIRDLNLPHHVRTLTIYEVYEDRAVEAVSAAARLQPPDPSGVDATDVLEILPTLHEGLDGLPGTPRTDYHADRWRTVRVSGAVDPDGIMRDIAFTETGQSAGAPTRITRAQQRVIDALVERSVQSSSVDHQTYNTLYELLVPRSMKGQGRPSEHIMYLLDDYASTLPFEMLATRSFDDGVVPIAIEVGVVRRLESTRIRELVRPSPGRKALVIGGPYVGMELPPLPGAIAEATKVADYLESHDWEVRRLISRDQDDRRIDAEAILNALFAHEYRIVHIAAHGAYDDEDESRSGIQIGPDDFLTAAEFEQMQTTPDLVFLNCCHSGSGVGRPDKLASSVSRKLIDNGIRAVIAAGWAVDDKAASDFAEELYSRLLTGENLGSATLLARQRVHRDHGTRSNTWGAYQVYGEPAFQLERQAPVARKPQVTSRRALHEAIESVRQRAMFAQPADLPALQTELKQLMDAATEEKWVQGRERQLEGEAYRCLGEYSLAIDRYRQALGGLGAAAGFDVIAQLVSALAHEGAKAARVHGELPPNPTALVDVHGHFAEADRLLSLWRDLVESAPRGGPSLQLQFAAANLEQQQLWGRVAGDPSELTNALDKAARAFQEIVTTLDDPGSRDHGYAAVVGSVLAHLAHLRRPRGGSSRGRQRELDERRSLLESVRARAQESPWSSALYERLRLPDTELALHIVGAASASPGDVVAAMYHRVLDEGLSRRERMTVRDWALLVDRCLPEKADLAELHGLLGRLAEAMDPATKQADPTE